MTVARKVQYASKLFKTFDAPGNTTISKDVLLDIWFQRPEFILKVEANVKLCFPLDSI